MPEALVLGATLRAGRPDLALIIALSLANVPEALSGTAGMRLASRSPTYVMILWSGTTFVTAAITALAFHFLSDLGPHATATFKAYGAGALIAMTAEKNDPGGLPQWAPLFRRFRRWGVRSLHPARRTHPVASHAPDLAVAV